MVKIGLIVNPVAGMGGSVGLKGSDGAEILSMARSLGAIPQSSNRTQKALEEFNDLKNRIQLLTYPRQMGENAAKASGFDPIIIGNIPEGDTKPEDTLRAAQQMKEEGVDLILFAGGDGTARNIYDAVGTTVPALGIPAGVKIHSAVYGQNPRRTGELVRQIVLGEVVNFQEAEVMDIDEDAFRQERVVAQLYGYLNVPFEKKFVQARKSGGITGEESALAAMANYIVNSMKDDYVYIIGPGTTTRSIMQRLELDYTLLGVDVVKDRKLMDKDVTEKDLLQHIRNNTKTKIILTIIGGQGYILGRGNQQLSPTVLKEVGKENIIVVATRDKLNTIFGSPMLIDTGDEEMNKTLEGYYKVVVGYEDFIMYKAMS